MQHGMYLNAAGALAAEARIDVAANNLANVDTPGFRRGFAVFQKRATEALEAPRWEPSRRPVLDQLGGGLFVEQTTYDPLPAPHKATGNPLDLALEGDGFFSIEREGERFFSRAGNFQRSHEGLLVTADGQGQVLNSDGKPIFIPEGRVAVAEDGTLRVDDRPLGKLWIQGKLDHRRFEPRGDTLYRYIGDGPIESAAATVHQGFLERSSVSPVREMVGLIRTFRAYEANMNMLKQQDESLGRAVNDVGRIG